jgi:thioredoxin-like negative regulator of GroEL
LLLFKEGQVVDRIVGAVPKHLLEEKINSYIFKN